jgi:hypothetical protein
MASKQSETFSPEMIRILKIFGIGTLVFVFIMSFFNEKRANNSGLAPSEMRITDADRLYFRNVRASSYDLEGRNDAKMNIYRHGKREKSQELPTLNFAIFLNRVVDEAYIFIEPYPEELPLQLRFTTAEEVTSELTFYGGNKFDHFNFAMEFFQKFEEGVQLQMKVQDEWVSILEEEKERDILKTVFSDYFRLINKPK